MIRKAVTLFFLVTLFSIQGFPDPAIRSVAVTDFTSNGFPESQSWIGESCTDVIIRNISSDKNIRIVERSQLNRIIEELKLQMGGLVNNESALETGNLIGVTYFITGSVSKFEDQVVLSSRSFSVETGEILSTSLVRGPLSDLFRLQEEIALNICRDLNFVTLSGGETSSPLQKFEVYQKIEYLKRMAANVPKFNLDPQRKIRINEYLNSIQQADDLIKLNPEYYLPHYYKALFSMHLGDFGMAEKEAAMSCDLSNGAFEPSMLRASVLLNSGNIEKARGLIEFLTSTFPDNPEGWLLLSRIQTNESQYVKAVESLIYSLLGNNILPQALANLRAGLSVSFPGKEEFSTDKLYNIARLYNVFWSKKNETSEIFAIARTIQTEFPNFYLPLYFLGRSEMKEKKFSQAVNSIQKCLSYYPDFPEAHRDIALSYFSIKQCDRADLHVTLYLQMADAITDYDVIEEARKKCKH